jgi:serine protease AprX
MRAQPALAYLASSSPTHPVRVIVQKAAGASDAEQEVVRLGGRVIRDLSIIHAFVAEMTVDAALKLSQMDEVRWVSLDAAFTDSGKPTPPPTTNPSNYYLDTLRVRNVWAMGLQGQGIGIAIVDSGVTTMKDFQVDPSVAKPDSRVVVQQSFNYNAVASSDVYGHGTHVAGIAAGSGYLSNGAYTGIAPKANIISLRVSDDTGKSYESDVVAALQWIYDNRSAYNIRVVNLSLNSTVPVSYHQSPLDAAVEILWFNGVVVVVSAGNYSTGAGNPILSAPANDPFVITVGAIDEKGTSKRTDDVWANFSAIGNTQDGFYKPEIHAPGKNIVSVLNNAGQWSSLYPERVVMNGDYFRLSGTSMSAPMVAGVAALLLQDEPNLTPDQVKYRIINKSPWQGSVRYLDAYAVVTGTTTQSSNTGISASQLLWTGTNPITWNSVGWNSVGWNSVGWNSVGWNSVGWNSVGWNSTFWGP